MIWYKNCTVHINIHDLIWKLYCTNKECKNCTESGEMYEPPAGGVWILSQPIQSIIIVLIIIITVFTNTAIIINISCSQIKRSTVNFVLIKHLCIVDLFGALFILPVPLVTTIKGNYTPPLNYIPPCIIYPPCITPLHLLN